MNTLEEFEKRLSNLLDFIDENKEELIQKHNVSLNLNCFYMKDDDMRYTGATIGNPFDSSIAIYSLFKIRPEFIEFLEKTIEVAKRSSKR